MPNEQVQAATSGPCCNRAASDHEPYTLEHNEKDHLAHGCQLVHNHKYAAGHEAVQAVTDEIVRALESAQLIFSGCGCGGDYCPCKEARDGAAQIIIRRIDADAKRIAELTADRDEAIRVAQKRAERIATLEYIVAAIRTRCADVYRNPNSPYARGVADLTDEIMALIGG